MNVMKTDTDPESGLCLLTYRYYSPAHGSFLTRDPSGAEPNLYALYLPLVQILRLGAGHVQPCVPR